MDSDGNVQVYHTDWLGSVRAVTDANGNVTQTYQTDEFGVPTQTSGSSSQPFRYSGQQSDDDTGLYYLRERMYDPAIGRIWGRDSVVGSVVLPISLNRNSYHLNKPSALVGPTGLSSNRLTRG